MFEPNNHSIRSQDLIESMMLAMESSKNPN